jgi:ADP-heptose:LPS heptosyltransferase
VTREPPAPRSLLYRALGLGDFLTGVPAYRAVARAYPGREVCLAAPEPLRPLAALCEAVDTFLPTDPLGPPPWSGPPPELAVNLHGRGPQSHRVLAALRPGRLVAFAEAQTRTPGPRWRADEHEVHRWCRLLAESGVPADPTDLRLAVPAQRPPGRAATVVHPGAADPARRWPADRFAAVAAALAAAGHDVVVTAGPGEADLARAVAAGAGLPGAAALAGTLDLAALAALVAAARLVVCGDTGVAHLATAYATPSVVLFAAVSPALWGPPAQVRHRVVWHRDLAAAAHRAPGPHPALAAVTVEQVLAEATTVTQPPVLGAGR